jgi:uncharacterized protein YndB with AHSA1/START domain
MRTLALLVVWMSFGAPAAAEVIDSTVNGFAVRNVAQIAAHPSRVYSTAASLVSRWWNPAHTFSSNSANLSLDARPGGCFCESVANGGVVHLTVVSVVAQQEVRFSGGTQFEWTYTVGGYMPGGLAAIAPAVDAVLADQLNRLKRFVETGRPE